MKVKIVNLDAIFLTQGNNLLIIIFLRVNKGYQTFIGRHELFILLDRFHEPVQSFIFFVLFFLGKTQVVIGFSILRTNTNRLLIPFNRLFIIFLILSINFSDFIEGSSIIRMYLSQRSKCLNFQLRILFITPRYKKSRTIIGFHCQYGVRKFYGFWL